MNIITVTDKWGQFQYVAESSRMLDGIGWLDDEVMNFFFWKEVSLCTSTRDRAFPVVMWLRSWISEVPRYLLKGMLVENLAETTKRFYYPSHFFFFFAALYLARLFAS